MDPQTRQPQSQYTEDKSLTEKAGDQVQKAADQVSQAADTVRNRAGDALDTAKQKTAEAAEVASDRANDTMTAAGDQMTNLAQTIRDRAPMEGRAGDIASNAAETLERSGRYLQEADPQAVRTDLERVIREHPIESMLVGLGIGYLLARTLKR